MYKPRLRAITGVEMTRSAQAISAIFLIISTGTALSETANKPLDMTIECNRHGAILTDARGQKTYLGKDCDAYQPDKGTGKWWLTASAYALEINGKASLLPVEVDCDLPPCWLDG